MNDDAKRANRQHDRSHETMPPELRPFVKPAPPQRLVAPEDEPEFNAAILALKMINGGPEADPFYVDPKAEAAAEPKPQAPLSVKVYAPPVAVSVRRGAAVTPQNETGYVDTRALQALRGAKGTATPILVGLKSAAEPSATRGQRHATEDGHEPGAIDIRPFKAALAAHEAATRREAEAEAAKAEDETTLQQPQSAGSGPANSPWANEAAVAPIAAANLPSSLAPGATSEPAPQSEQPARVPVGGNTRVRVLGVLAVLALLGFAAFQLMPKTHPQEALVPVPARSAGPAVAPPEASGAAVAPPVAPSVSATVPPPAPTGTVEVGAGAIVAPSAPVAPPKPRTKLEDPYDASAPGPAKTAEAVVPAPTVPPVITAAPSIPPTPTVAPSAKPSLVGGDKGVF